jgi:uncharacterized protein (TIGR03032 family)
LNVDLPVREDAGYNPDKVRLVHSPNMAAWLLSQQVSLAYTSYATGRLIVVGVEPGGRLFFNEQNYTRAMGLHYSGDELFVASLYQIWRLCNVLQPGEFANNAFDCVLVPREASTTGYLDVHELSLDAARRPLFINTRYSCLATTDSRFSFQPIWWPPFISELAPQDRCHLNGIAVQDGVPRYATAFSTTDVESGWRAAPGDAGVLIDVQTGKILSEGLYMPHSPRIHDGATWLLESGRGWLVRIDPVSGEKVDIAFCPGYVRGLAFHQDFAIVAVSKARQNSETLPLHRELAKYDAEPWCAILVVDLKQRLICNFIRYETEITELFDVAVMPGIRNPMTIGPATEEILTAIRFRGDFASSV